jgi:PAS domain-containing protein
MAENLNQMINSVFENCGKPVFGVNAHGHVGYWNLLFEQLLDLPKNVSIIGKHCSDLLCGSDKLCRLNNCQACALGRNFLHQRQINEFVLTLSRSNGEDITVSIGSCYFYQNDDSAPSTYFSLRKLNN